jgi:hypothetical protein
MKTRPVFPFLTSSLLLLSGGCGFFQGDKTADQTQPNPTDPAAQAPPPVPVDQIKPMPEVDMAALGLIPPVTPSQRRSEIMAGRNNPFALIPIQATLRQPDQIGGLSEGSTSTAGEASGSSTTQGTSTQAGDGTTSNQANTKGGSTSTSNLTAIAPPAFEPPPLYPNDARAVVVSGIVQIEQKDFAIVKAPGETVARHVTVGDRLSDGQVIVKSINTSQGSPGVVLEQYDQSVVRPVGAPALPPLPETKADAVTTENPGAGPGDANEAPKN